MKRVSHFVMNCLLLGMIACGFAATASCDELHFVHSQPSYLLESPQVSLAITQLGGHMAPVTFYRNTSQPIQPYYISPWQDETPVPMPAPVLVPLRGDFFCLPFGGNAETVNGERHPPHGETASNRWNYVSKEKSGPVTTLTMTIDTTGRPGKITKKLSLVDGQNVVYSSHSIDGFAGRTPVAHHATLAMPEEEGTVRLATSPIQFGMTYPGLFSDPRLGEYQSLLPGTKWKSLSQVPVAWKGTPDADLTRLPARKGHADLVQLVNDPHQNPDQPAWAAATFTQQRYVWFSLKNPAVLNSTMLWIENHGRHGHPWNGRNHCLGVEDITSFFSTGLQSSLNENLLTQAGVSTTLNLTAETPTSINYIQGVVQIPPEFDYLADITFAPGKATFVAANGQQVSTSVAYEFLESGNFPQR